jgi:hypothetical protein
MVRGSKDEFAELLADLRESYQMNETLRLELAVAQDERVYLKTTLEAERAAWVKRAGQYEDEIARMRGER